MKPTTALLLLTALGVAVACTQSPGEPDRELSNSPPSAPDAAEVTYEVQPDRLRVGDTPLATFTNAGTAVLEYGHGYELERKQGGRRWVRVEQPPNPKVHCAFTDIALTLPPGKSQSERISVCDRRGEDRQLAPGLYRVSKTFGVRGSDSIEVEALFRVVP